MMSHPGSFIKALYYVWSILLARKSVLLLYIKLFSIDRHFVLLTVVKYLVIVLGNVKF
jgi:hypothetical protein